MTKRSFFFFLFRMRTSSPQSTAPGEISHLSLRSPRKLREIVIVIKILKFCVENSGYVCFPVFALPPATPSNSWWGTPPGSSCWTRRLSTMIPLFFINIIRFFKLFRWLTSSCSWASWWWWAWRGLSPSSYSAVKAKKGFFLKKNPNSGEIQCCSG